MRYSVQVKLNKNFLKEEGGKVVVGIKAKPEGGKANDELLAKLARHFKVSVSSIRLVSGRTSRNKIVEVRGR